VRAGRFSKFLPAVLFAMAAIAVCAPSLIHRSWWIDELITRDISRLPLFRLDAAGTTPFTHSILFYTLHDTGPGPLLYLLEGMFSRLAYPMGGEFWLRISGILAGACATGFLYFLCRVIIGHYGAVVAATVAVFLPAFLEAYTGARGYAWLIFFALVQLYAIYAALRGDGRAIIIWMFTAGAILGMFVNAVHVVWTSCLVLLVVLSHVKRPSTSRAAMRTRVSALAVLVTISAGWLGIWLHSVMNARTGSATSLTGVSLSVAVKRAFLESRYVPGLIISNLAAALLLFSYRSRAARLHAVLSLVVSVASVIFLLVLNARFFAAPRYFYPLWITLLVSCAFVFQRMAIRMRRNARSWLPAGFAVAVQVIVVGLLAADAYRTVSMPVQDWWGATEYIKQHAKPDDIVLTGPNSEYEVYRLYAKAAGVQAQAPLMIEDALRRQFPLDRVEGLRMLLSQKPNVWFVTAALWQHRSKDYWALINNRFKPVATIPGQGAITVLKSQP
jgi:hypothetical protein